MLVLALLLAWPVGLGLWANGRLERVDALSGGADTPGTTYLLSGSDSRGGALVNDATAGERTDTMMLLHVPPSGPAALISLPRDTYVEIPGHGAAKLNAAYGIGGPEQLVASVEELTGIGVDHFVEVGFDGIYGVVEAVGGVRLCLDYDVRDKESKLAWNKGCHVAGGRTAIAFARMRKADPEGDIGRAARQQQLIKAITKEAVDPGILVRPGDQVALVRAGTDALVVSEGTTIVDMGRLALAFRRANGPDGITGTPWIESLDYRPGGIGSAVLLDDERNAQLFADLVDGSMEPGKVGGMPG